MKKILIGPSVFAKSDPAPLEKLIKSGFEVVNNPYGRKLTDKELSNLLSGVDGLIAGLENLSGDILRRSALKVISRCGAGMSNVDLGTAKEMRIKVFSTPDAPTEAVAELTIGALLGMLRHIPQMNADLHNGAWSKKIGEQLEGKTVAIIGFGRIGRRVAELLKPFKVNIISVDPNPAVKAKGINFLSLEDALPVSDVITVHAAGDRAILGDREFRIIKNGALLLNPARGNIIDEAELVRALDSGRISAVWLDCFKEEPYAGPLSKYPQAILTPHVGSYTSECRKRMEMESVENLIAGFRELEGRRV